MNIVSITWRGLRDEPLYGLLLAVPVAVILDLFHANDVAIFLTTCLAVIPLAGLMGRATENLAETLGAGIGGLLNATFGNAAELIIALFALSKGPKFYPLIKASLTGSIIGNVLLVLGLAILCGGLRYQRQVFNRTAASMGTTMLALACIGLLMPTVYTEILLRAPLTAEQVQTLGHLSYEIAGILAGVYLLSLVFALRTHRHLFAGPREEMAQERSPEWSRRKSLLVLLAATAGVALMSEMLVDSVDKASAVLGNQIFVGVIVVAIIGNAAEHSTAVMMALKDKMDIAVNIAIGSSLQVALFVAPMLVFASLLMGHDPSLDLHFTPLEFLTILASIGVLALVSQDGETHWMEGVMLLAVYGIIALAFFHMGKALAEVR